ncbi:hypothetical protein [Pyrococcus yayanosii]|uniref:Rubrerythrin diiron-binding domain-containing protein n=1 Tax=Pyrococcus yayanosii (strain CH1 / JCM 16557) TaxID=529709 RepID=F8AI65_PYRYC|nr:hypothetical protein [Pyrococcus yayanosii]AEH24292.1 hypothetical protein PYCH_06040 [Pyrococcus yayanosii CH1]
MGLAGTVKGIREVEERALKEYIDLLKELKDPEDAELKRVVLRLAVDKIFHRELALAIERAYREATKLLKEHLEPFYPELEPIRESVLELDNGVALVPGLPALLLPPDLEKLGVRIPPEEVLEELVKGFPEPSLLPVDKAKEIREKLARVVEMEERMKKCYGELQKKAQHPVIKDIAKSVMHNEDQHGAILKKVLQKFANI